MAEFPALPLWTDSYLGDTTHLTTIQHGVYLLLLISAWRSKACDLPDDDKLLARYSRLTLGQWLRIKPFIAPFWRISNGVWSNGRLLDERDSVRRLAQQRSDAGKASALKRLHRGSTVVQRNGNGTSTPYSYSKPTEGISSLRSEMPPPEKPKRKSKSSLPDNFPDDAGKTWAEQKWLVKGRADLCGQMDEIIERFRDHHTGKQTYSASWPGSWRTWAAREMNFTRSYKNGNGQGTGNGRLSPHEKFARAGLSIIEDLERGKGTGDHADAGEAQRPLLAT